MDVNTIRQKYEGRDLAECFVLLELKFNRDIEIAKQDLKEEFRTSFSEVKQKVSKLESFAKNMTENIREIHEKTVANI